MIKTSIRVKGKTIECDFHQPGREFSDFYQFFEYVLAMAHKKAIYRLRIIHGKGKDRDGLSPLPDTIIDRLSNTPEVEWYERPEGRLAEVLVYLRKDLSKSQTSNPLRKDLRSLYRDLKKDEEAEFKANRPRFVEKKKKKPSDDLQELYSRLDFSWEEDSVASKLEELMAHREYDQAMELLEYVRDFEVFFSEKFRVKYLNIQARLCSRFS